MPRVLPFTSVPMKAERFHFWSRSDALACGMLRAMESMMAMVCSAAAMVLPVGALTTAMPRRVAASRSTLSTPTPARPTTCSCAPASMTAAVTCVSLRTMRASASATASRSSPSGMRSRRSTVRPGWASRMSIPSWWMGSVMRTFM